MKTKYIFLAVFLLSITGIACVSAKDQQQWIQLFNGKNLDGWTPKICGHKLGDNYKNTFRVKDGILQANYDEYENFDKKFGHLFYKDKFSDYRLRVEYRFVGEQIPGGPSWAWRNNGIMIHCQPPETMDLDQNFPDSIEVQLLGGDGEKERSTLNLCTPGTDVVKDGQLYTKHTMKSSSKTYHGDQWVTVEVEVRGSEVIKHIIDGQVVLQYEKPQLDTRKSSYFKKNPKMDPMLGEGYISLQAESHPTEFRRIELLPLE